MSDDRIIKRHPLEWPEHQPRVPWNHRENGQFQTDHPRAFKNVKEEVRKMNIPGDMWVLSSHAEVTLEGVPRVKPANGDPAVCLWFKRKGKLLSIACDRFNTIAANMQAIALILDGRRREERYGTDAMVEAAWSAFEAPALPVRLRWWEVFGVNETTDEEIVEAAYKAMARKFHPDNQDTGSATRFAELSEAIQAARTFWREKENG